MFCHVWAEGRQWGGAALGFLAVSEMLFSFPIESVWRGFPWKIFPVVSEPERLTRITLRDEMGLN